MHQTFLTEVSGVSCDMGMVILFVYDANHLQHNVQAVGEYIKTTVVACLTSSI